MKRKYKPILSYPGLRYAQKILNFASKKNFEKCLFAYEIRFAVEKKTKIFLGQIFKLLEKFFVSPSKNASHTIPIYGNCMISIFFKKREPQFFITRMFYKNQTSTEISLYQISTIFRNCMKIVWQAFFHTLDVWNCMITIFGVWRSTRDMDRCS